MGNALMGEFFYMFKKYGPEIAGKYSSGHTKKLHLTLLCDMTGMVGYRDSHGHLRYIFYFGDMDDAAKKMRNEMYELFIESDRERSAIQWKQRVVG